MITSGNRIQTSPMSNSNILLIEDDLVLSEQLHNILISEGFCVEICRDGLSGLKEASKDKYQLVVLDVMLPNIDGFELLTRLRECSQVPVIILSAKGAEEERIKGLRKGADDYLSKPFNTQELLLRIEALLRRCNPEDDFKAVGRVKLGGLVLDKTIHQFQVNSHNLELTPVEFKLLRTLVSSQGDILSKAFLYQTVLNRAYSAYDRSLDMHLCRIRRKLNNAGWEGARLQTIHGKGYILS